MIFVYFLSVVLTLSTTVLQNKYIFRWTKIKVIMTKITKLKLTVQSFKTNSSKKIQALANSVHITYWEEI